MKDEFLCESERKNTLPLVEISLKYKIPVHPSNSAFLITLSYRFIVSESEVRENTQNLRLLGGFYILTSLLHQQSLCILILQLNKNLLQLLKEFVGRGVE